MKRGTSTIILISFIILVLAKLGEAQLKTSENTEACLTCHSALHPGIVAEWKKSQHANIIPSDALKKPKLERRISHDKITDPFSKTVVGCAECHTINSE